MDKQFYLSLIKITSKRLAEKKTFYYRMAVDIALLEMNGFLINAKQQKIIINYTSLYEFK